MTEPTRIVLAKGYFLPDDPDAVAYITAVEAADTAAGSPGGLEPATRMAINSFVKGCKADGIWPAIKASCILAGAQTLAGALVPLVGTAPTNVGGLFSAGDYNRKTGLVGNGSSTYLNSNTAILSAWQNNVHVSTYVSTGAAGTYLGSLNAGTTAGTQLLSNSSGSGFLRLNSSSSSAVSAFNGATGLVAAKRSSSSSIELRISSSTSSISNTSVAPPTEEIYVFAGNLSGSLLPAAARLAFYSIGESLDLAALDNRVTDLINAINAAF